MKFILVQFTLAVVFMFIYLKGYFPFTHHETTIINPPTEIEEIPLDLNQFYKPQVQKMVMIIIDALRYDFVTEKDMPFLYSNMDCLLKVKVEAPTVTLPRIKALTTGAIPQFIDIVLNLGATAKVADSFLHRAHASGKKMVFYGDNTWLMMFPNLFVREEGTTSFFVNDFTEVDNNVTRHIDSELKKDWDMMFLHYLGLDHIGHVRGPFNSLIHTKLHEMDNIIKKIITTSNTWDNDTIIMITGDHGMKDSGGHGGTTYAETHVPLILHHNKGINCNLHAVDVSDQIIQQSDIANTISALFGIAMPANSAGKILPQLLTLNKSQLLYTLFYNSLILQRNAENLNNCHENLQLARYLFKNAVQTSNFETSDARKAEKLFKQCLQQMSDELIQTSVKQDTILLVFAMLGSLNCFLVICGRFKDSLKLSHTFLTIVPVIILLSSFTFTYYNFEMQIAATILIGILTLITVSLTVIPSFCFYKVIGLFCVSPIIFHGALLISSSYIEEEQYFFYYFTCTASVLIAIINYRTIKRVTMSTAMPLTIIEIIRITRGISEAKDWLLKDEHTIYLKVLHTAALIATVIVIFKLQNSNYEPVSIIFSAVIFVMVHLHTFYYDRSVVFAQTIWFLILLYFLIATGLKNKNSVLFTWMLVMAFQLRPYNTILLPAMVICSCIFKKSIISGIKNNLLSNYLVVIHVWLGYTFFFIQGHRNSIANIDLVPGYLGLSNYVPFLVGLLTVCHSYGFQTLSLLLLFSTTIDTKPKSYETWKTIFCYKMFILLVIYIVLFFSRGHLFIWSVFAPKLLIECMHTFVLYLQMLLYGISKLLNYVKISLCKKINIESVEKYK